MEENCNSNVNSDISDWCACSDRSDSSEGTDISDSCNSNKTMTLVTIVPAMTVVKIMTLMTACPGVSQPAGSPPQLGSAWSGQCQQIKKTNLDYFTIYYWGVIYRPNLLS